MNASAALAVVALCGLMLWNFTADHAVHAPAAATQIQDIGDGTGPALFGTDQATTSDSVFTSPISADILDQLQAAYVSNVSSDGSYTPAVTKAAHDIGANINPQLNYQIYAAGDVKTTPDTSADRVLSYRADLRTALEPLLKNQNMELEIYGQYVQTGDARYLDTLHAYSLNYHVALANAAKVIAPSDAASYHAGILNAMGEFAATLDAMVDSATDPLASAALLKTYNSAEADMLSSFGAIGAYAAQKTI